MKKIKFVVKLNRNGLRVPEYAQRIDRTPVQMTTNRKRALVMGDSPPKTSSNLFKPSSASRS
jgi:hypothetical protein